MKPETWVALAGSVLALVGVWLGSLLASRSARSERRSDVRRDAFGRYLAGCAAWDALALHHFDPEVNRRPSDDALNDAQPALEVLHIIASRELAKAADVYLATLQVIADFMSPARIAALQKDGAEYSAAQSVYDRAVSEREHRREALLAAMRAEGNF